MNVQGFGSIRIWWSDEGISFPAECRLRNLGVVAQDDVVVNSPAQMEIRPGGEGRMLAELLGACGRSRVSIAQLTSLGKSSIDAFREKAVPHPDHECGARIIGAEVDPLRSEIFAGSLALPPGFGIPFSPGCRQT